MRKLVFIFIAILTAKATMAQEQPVPDTVTTGIYITSIHDIDFKEKQYSINCWIWLKYKNKDFRFEDNLEVPGAKTVEKSFVSIDTTGGKVYMQMKLQCVMKDSWRIGNFPFDRQRLRLSIENSQFDSKSLIFKADTVGANFDPRFTLSGWEIDSCIVSTNIKQYETAFGVDGFDRPHSEYSAFRVRLVIDRSATGLFWKMFLGMYMSFLIAFVCFFIHADIIDARFGLAVGALFAVVGNKYIIDSALPESTTFTLVDTLHGLTLFCILAVITANVYSLKLVKKGKHAKADKFDVAFAKALMIGYVLLNVWFIWRASRGK